MRGSHADAERVHARKLLLCVCVLEDGHAVSYTTYRKISTSPMTPTAVPALILPPTLLPVMLSFYERENRGKLGHSTQSLPCERVCVCKSKKIPYHWIGGSFPSLSNNEWNFLVWILGEGNLRATACIDRKTDLYTGSISRHRQVEQLTMPSENIY